MKKTMLKLMLTLFVVSVNNYVFAQSKSEDFDKIQRGIGEYIANHKGDNMLGIWRSTDGNYTFNVKKEIVHHKRGVINFKTDNLVLNLIDVKLKSKLNNKNLNAKFFFSISEGSAKSYYEDPDTKNPVEILLYFRGNDKIDMYTKNSIIAEKQYCLFFPEKLILIRVK